MNISRLSAQQFVAVGCDDWLGIVHLIFVSEHEESNWREYQTSGNRKRHRHSHRNRVCPVTQNDMREAGADSNRSKLLHAVMSTTIEKRPIILDNDRAGWSGRSR